MVESLLQNYNFEGNWWGRVGRTAQNSFSGIFEFAGPEGQMHLDLDGIFVNRVVFEDQEQRTVALELPVIFGQLNDERLVSLINCFLGSSSETESEARAQYVVNLVVIGQQISSFEDLYFSRARFTLTGISEPIFRNHSSLSYLNSGWKFCVVGFQECSDARGNTSNLAVFEMTSSVPWHINRFFREIFWIQNFFSVLQGTDCAVASLEVFSEIGISMDVLFKKDRQSVFVQGPPNPLMNIELIDHLEFNSAFAKWLQSDEQYRLAVYHFIAAMQFSSPKHQVNLVNISQAMEALHRSIFRGQDLHIHDSDYRSIEQTI